MTARRTRRAAVLASLALGAAAALPASASAHGLVGKQDLPLPRWLFAWGAAVVPLPRRPTPAPAARAPSRGGGGSSLLVFALPAVLVVLGALVAGRVAARRAASGD